MDFVSDQFTDDRRFRILTVVDDCTRECLAPLADTSLSGVRMAREFDRLISEHGKPKMIVSDSGTGFTSNVNTSAENLTKVAYETGDASTSYAKQLRPAM